jgi:hypothetical protein
VTGVHGDAMADYQHEIEVHEGPKKKSRCTLRVNHESGTLLGTAPTGMKEMVKLLDLIVARVQLGILNDDTPEQVDRRAAAPDRLPVRQPARRARGLRR